MSLVNVCVLDTSCSRLLVSWTVFCLEDERMTLGSLFEMIVARVSLLSTLNVKTVWTRTKSREKTLKSSADLFVCSVKMQL